MWKNTSISLVWFGASVTITEVMVGLEISSTGLTVGLLAIILGHALGWVLIFLIAHACQKLKRETLNSFKYGFGNKGVYLFSILNAIQMLGWAIVLMSVASNLCSAFVGTGWFKENKWFWALMIGVFTFLWLFIKEKYFQIFNIILSSIMLIMFMVIFISTLAKETVNLAPGVGNDKNFFSALELSISMPLSWLPVIGDYVSKEQKSQKNIKPILITIGYGVGSTLMFIVGLFIGLSVAKVDDTNQLMRAFKDSNLSYFITVIIVLSTVTTNFLNVISSTQSFKTVVDFDKKWDVIMHVGLILVAILGSSFFRLEYYENYLGVISAIFLPISLIFICNYYIFKDNCINKTVDIGNIIIWVISFALYQVLTWQNEIGFDTKIGSAIIETAFVISVCSIKFGIVSAIDKRKVKEADNVQKLDQNQQKLPKEVKENKKTSK